MICTIQVFVPKYPGQFNPLPNAHSFPTQAEITKAIAVCDAIGLHNDQDILALADIPIQDFIQFQNTVRNLYRTKGYMKK